MDKQLADSLEATRLRFEGLQVEIGEEAEDDNFRQTLSELRRLLTRRDHLET